MYYIGIDLGGTNIAAGVVNEKYEILAKGSVPTGRLRPYEEIIGDMASLCKRLIKQAGLTEKDIEAIGFASPGTPIVEDGCFTGTENIPSFFGTPVVDELKKYFPDKKIYIENDANAAAYGESLAGAARGEKDVVMITLGTGIGGGIIIDGKVYAGFNHAGAELGHIIIERDGVPCSCGRRGCWEAYASVTALIRQTEEIIKEYPDSIIHEMLKKEGARITGRTSFEAMQKGDKAGRVIVEQYIKNIATGVISMISVFQPKKFIIGGGISREGETILAPLREHVINAYPKEPIPRPEIVQAELGGDAGIVGAAMICKQL
ncbi:MAG: ROK family protein [Clostridia bacterium]|nr:ROK family protein [Clostridia bacterium]